MLHSVMVGAGENYLSAFGIFLQATTVQVGLLASLPALLGGLSQVLSLQVLSKLPSRRQLLVLAARVQSLIWIPIALLPLAFEAGPEAAAVLIGLVILYHVAAGFFAPTWSSLIGDILPPQSRGRFLGLRSQRSGLTAFISLSLCGQVLEFARRHDAAAVGFMAIFFIAGLARWASSRWLARHDDPPGQEQGTTHFTLWQFIVRSPRSNYGRFVFFMGCVNFGVSFSGPYFALFLLRDLHYSYLSYTVVTATAVLTQFLTMQHWGKIADRFGSKKILNYCGVGICINPALWLISHDLAFIIFIQIFSGIVWAGFNLAASTFLFDAVTPPKRARCAAYQSLVSSVFLLAGSTLGGYTASHLPKSFQLGPLSWEPVSPLLVIFLLSGVIRAVIAWFFLPKFREVREVAPSIRRELVFRIAHLRPLSGVSFALSSVVGRRPRKGTD